MSSTNEVATATVADVVDDIDSVRMSPGTSNSGISCVLNSALAVFDSTAEKIIVPPETVVPAVSTEIEHCPLVIVVPLSAVDPDRGENAGDPPSVALSFSRSVPIPFVFDDMAHEIDIMSARI